MLSDITLIVAVLLLPISCYFSFKLGVNTAISIGNSEKTPVFVSKPLKKYKKLPETKENQRLNAILANIEAYDGTGLGQKEIE
jgi:hypothetical protein